MTNDAYIYMVLLMVSEILAMAPFETSGILHGVIVFVERVLEKMYERRHSPTPSVVSDEHSAS